MSLRVPSRRPGSAGQSFLTSAVEVQSWANRLFESGSSDWKQKLYRGLKHCNRLDVNSRRRVEILTILEPVIDHALDELVMLYYEQPLPLGRKPAKAHQLAGSLLQELSYAWHIVVNDTYATLLQGQQGVRAQAILRALRVCSKRFMHHSLIYNPLPTGLLSDANTLYKYAEDSGFEKTDQRIDNTDDTWTITQAWMHIQLLALSDLRTQRVTQIPLIIQLLESLAEPIEIQSGRIVHTADECLFSVHLEQDSPPLPADHTAPKRKPLMRFFNLTAVIENVKKEIELAPITLNRESETRQLQRSSLQRIVERWQPTRKRESQRTISYQPASLHTGLKDIHSYITSGQTPKRTGGSGDTGWRIVNGSAAGYCIAWDGQRNEYLQVDELVALIADDATDLLVGRVVWMSYQNGADLTCGIDVLTDKVAAVTAQSRGSDSETYTQDCLLSLRSVQADATQENGDASTTLLAPVNTFEHASQLTIHQQNQTREWSIDLRRPESALFDHLDVSAVK